MVKILNDFDRLQYPVEKQKNEALGMWNTPLRELASYSC